MLRMVTQYIKRPLTYEEFRQSMSNLYHYLPEILQKDFILFFCPEGCPEHTLSKISGRSNHNFGKTYGNVVRICYDCFKYAHRFDERHCYKVLIHEIEHAVNPDTWHHSEHLYDGCTCKRCKAYSLVWA